MNRRTRSIISRSTSRLVLLGVMALVVASCGGTDDTQIGAGELLESNTTLVVANTPGSLTTGTEQRVLVALLGAGPNEFIGSDTRPATVLFSEVDGDGAGTVQGEFLSNEAVNLGLYVTPFTFERAGEWEVRIEGTSNDGVAARIQIVEDSPVPQTGEAAPASITPTSDDAEALSEISTDPEPDPDLYDLSIDEAVSNGRPTVVVFATPAFCQTALCGPTIEIVKDAAAGNADLDVVHVEPFDIGAATEGSLEPIATMDEWGLATEPWVFVVDEEGKIAASFEGIIGRSELVRAIEDLA